MNEVEQAVTKQVLKVVVRDLQQVLSGGVVNLLGQNVSLLGLRNVRTIVDGTIASLPRDSKLLPALHQVAGFASLAIEGLAFAGPAIGTIGTPLTVQRIDLAGRTTPIASYAVAIAAVLSLMFVTLLLAAGMLALERSENAYPRLVRGLVRPEALLGEKIALAGISAALLSLLLSAIVSVFVPLQWDRFELWLLALIAAGLAFAAMGVAIGELWGRPTHLPWGIVFCGPTIASGPGGACVAGLEPRHGHRRVRRRGLSARRGVVRVPVPRRPAGAEQRVQRHGAGDGLAARPPARPRPAVRRAGPPGPAPLCRGLAVAQRLRVTLRNANTQTATTMKARIGSQVLTIPTALSATPATPTTAAPPPT